MEVCERNSCVCVTTVTRDVVIGEEWFKCKRKQMTIDTAVAVKKDGIIVGLLPKYFKLAE